MNLNTKTFMFMGKIKLPIIFITVAFFFIGCNGGNKHRRTQSFNKTKCISKEKNLNFRVFVENSGSMDGYVRNDRKTGKNTRFKDDLYTLLSDIHISGIEKSMSFNFINTKIIPRKKSLDSFKDELSPYKWKIGKTSTTDLSQIMSLILDTLKKDDIALLISDYELSPGSRKNAAGYLKYMKNKIKVTVADYKNNFDDLAITIYRLSSDFHGYHYNIENHRQHYKDIDRPYFILMMGKKENLQSFSSHISEKKLKEYGVLQSYTLLPKPNNINYRILFSPKYGTYSLDHNNIKHIKDARTDTRNHKFMFSIGVDLSNVMLLGEKYLCDTSNYNLNNKNYTIEIQQCKSKKKSFTHIIKVSTSKKIITQANLQITLKSHLPQWINLYNDDKGINLEKDKAENKTYGIKNFIEGLHAAYTFNSNNYINLNILIN